MLIHRCTGPFKDDPYSCGVWLNLYWGWLRLWPLFIIRHKSPRIRFNMCLGRWVNADTGRNILLKLTEL